MLKVTFYDDGTAKIEHILMNGTITNRRTMVDHIKVMVWMEKQGYDWDWGIDEYGDDIAFTLLPEKF